MYGLRVETLTYLRPALSVISNLNSSPNPEILSNSKPTRMGHIPQRQSNYVLVHTTSAPVAPL